jgi:hypothetical protein
MFLMHFGALFFTKFDNSVGNDFTSEVMTFTSEGNKINFKKQQRTMNWD